MKNKLLTRQRLGNLRRLQIPQKLIDFSSNDYLGLARSKELAASVMQECNRHTSILNGLGSTGSRLLTGNSSYAEDLENRIAAFHGYDAGIIFSCGYMANVGLLSTIACSLDTVIFDAAIHASTRDGIHLSRAKGLPFKHNDLKHLECRLNNSSIQGDRFICIESIYSTDGSKAPLQDICRLANSYGAHLIVDEAHAIGVCGPNGEGLVSEQKLNPYVFAQINTFGKALGVYGAIILGSNLLKQSLINFAHSCIYTTALPFHALAAIKCSYDLFPGLVSERAHIQKLIQIFRKTQPDSSETHIQSIKIQGNDAVKQAAQNIANQGYNVSPLISPTVRRGHEVLRICLHAFNTEDELNNLLKVKRHV